MGGSRVGKDSPRIRAYGALDELASQLGLAESLLPPGSESSRPLLQRVQHELFTAMTELATPEGTAPVHRLTAAHVTALEREIDRLQVTTPAIQSFVLPRGTPAAAALHVARTVARRAEREIVALNRLEPVPPELRQWINRLSDLLFALAHATNVAAGQPEIPPDYHA